LGACIWPPGVVSISQSLYRLLGGIALRAGLPLAVGAAVHFAGGPLARAGFLYYVLVFYLAVLGVQTYLFIPKGRRSSAVAAKRDPGNDPLS
jgi:hypothetical protein